MSLAQHKMENPEEHRPSVETLCNFIFDLEKRHNLFAWQVGGVYVWPIIRMKVYYRLAEAAGLFQDTTHVKHNFLNKTKMLGVLLFSLFFRNPFLSLRRSKNVLVPHSRKVAGRDIYSDQLLNELGPETLVIDAPYYGTALKGSHTMDPFVLACAFTARLFKKLSPVQDETARAVQVDIQKTYKTDIPLESIISYEVYKFRLLMPLFRTLFKWHKAETLYIVVGYLFPFITAAAKEVGLDIVELQHGTITPFHLGYSYPDRPVIPYQADELLVFGSYWPETTDLPGQMKARVIGAPHIASIKAKAGEAKKERSIFFSAQTVNGPALLDFALETARLLPDYTITFNLHPNDKLAKFEALLAQRDVPGNFTMLYRPANIFLIIAQHEFQAGVFSTTLFEGMCLGTKVILIDMPGAEYMRPCVARGDAILVETPEGLAQELLTVKQVANTSDYYADPIHKIISQET